MIHFDNIQPEGEIFNLFSNSKLTHELFESMNSKMGAIIFLRLSRTGIIGQAIFDQCIEKTDELNLVRLEEVACLCELHIFYIRSLYDYLTNLLTKKLGSKMTNSFATVVIWGAEKQRTWLKEEHKSELSR